MPNCNESSLCRPEVVYVGYVYILTVVCALGTVFNIINLCVFYKKTFRLKIAHSTLYYLTGLAVADAAASLAILPLGLSRCEQSGNSSVQLFWNLYQIFIFLPLSNTFGTASVWITLIISAERCIFITWFSDVAGRKDGLFPYHTKSIVTAVFIVAVIFNIPFWFDYDVSVTISAGVLTFSEFSESLFYEVWLWMRLLLVKILPIFAVVIFNCILLRSTWINSKKYKIMTLPSVMSKKRQVAQTRMTAMMMSISTVFVVCHCLEPFVHTPVYLSIAGPCSIYTELYNVLVITVNVAEAISFASNFISYWIFNRQFVITLKMMAACVAGNRIQVEPSPVAATLQTRVRLSTSRSPGIASTR